MPDTSIKIKDVDGVVHNVDTHKLVDGDERQVFVLGDLENSGLIDLAAFIAQTHTDLTALLAKLGSVTLDTATLGALETIQIGSSALPTGAATSANQATGNTSLAAIVSALGSTLNVAPTVDGDVAGTLTDGRKTVTTPGTAVAIRASLGCKWVCATALKTNTDQVNVGGSGVLAASGSSTGSPLAAGESVTLPVSNANLVFVDARVTGEGVSFTVGS